MKEMKFIILPATRKIMQNFNIFQYHFYSSLTNTVEEESFNWKVYPVGFLISNIYKAISKYVCFKHILLISLKGLGTSSNNLVLVPLLE